MAPLIAEPLRQAQSYVTAYHHKMLRSDELKLNRNQGDTNPRRCVDSRNSLRNYLECFVRYRAYTKYGGCLFKQYSMPLRIFMEHLMKMSTFQSLYRRMIDCSENKDLKRMCKKAIVA